MSWEIFHGPKKVAFDPPPDWRLLPSTWPEDQTGPDDGPTGLTRQALDHPLDISLEDKDPARRQGRPGDRRRGQADPDQGYAARGYRPSGQAGRSRRQH